MQSAIITTITTTIPLKLITSGVITVNKSNNSKLAALAKFKEAFISLLISYPHQPKFLRSDFLSRDQLQ